MTSARTYFPRMRLGPLLRVLALVILAAVQLACGRLGETPPRIAVWLLPAQGDTTLGRPLSSNLLSEITIGHSFTLDSVSLRPLAAPLVPSTSTPRRVAVVTTYQGTRYHPETIRAVTQDSVALGAVAGALAQYAVATGASTVFFDLQGATPTDVREVVAFTRAVTDSASRTMSGPFGFIVPATDTAGYPTAILARSAAVIIVRLAGEHRDGTAPGPLASPAWISRHLGIRTREIGAKRVIAELPLYGYRWDRNGVAHQITFEQAQRLVSAESGTFRRDAESSYLNAQSSRDGWTIWVPDARTVERYFAVVRRSGVAGIALAGIGGADPQIREDLSVLLRR